MKAELVAQAAQLAESIPPHKDSVKVTRRWRRRLKDNGQHEQHAVLDTDAHAALQWMLKNTTNAGKSFIICEALRLMRRAHLEGSADAMTPGTRKILERLVLACGAQPDQVIDFALRYMLQEALRGRVLTLDAHI